jgi:hypothetical protein
MTDDDKMAFLDQPRDDKGKFASRSDPAPDTPAPAQDQPASEPVAAPVEVPAVSEPVKPPDVVPPGYIPIAAQLDERDKRQALQRELEEIKRKYEEATRKPHVPIDPIADPEEFDRQLNARFEQTQWDAVTRISHGFAIKQHGADAVKAAEDWLKTELETNPAMFQSIKSQSDPYDFVVRQHKRSLAMSKIGDDEPDAYARKWAEQNGYVLAGQQGQVVNGVAPSPQSTSLPRPSLASAPAASAGTLKIPTGPGVAFEEMFRK